ncbi:hypothetical protein KA977_00500 [Candidatus Dependentiae bacterium]|nr:hypothetical protein [Candidatus Dependentiae bacterium]
MILKKLGRIFFGTLRRQLIFGIAVVHAVLMTLFIYDLIQRQYFFIVERQTEQAIGMAQSLATSCAGWLSSDDVSGLQELVEIQRKFPELIFAFLTDRQGKVLAHTSKAYIGLYMSDFPKQQEQTIMNKSSELIDVIVPVKLAGHFVGWTRIGIGLHSTKLKLFEIMKDGFFYAIGAVLIGSLLAWFMGNKITRRLYVIKSVMDQVKKGDHTARSLLKGSDEAAQISFDLNNMLDILVLNEKELINAKEVLKKLNETLEERVREEIQKNISQNQILIHQSRLAAMGEMIRNIAHQWRQPLNALSVILANIKDSSDFDELDKKKLDDSLQKAEQFIQGMSVTIDDFRNYFKPNKEKQNFDVMEASNRAVKIMIPSFLRHNIKIDYELKTEKYQVLGYSNEFSQVMVVVLTNAKDAIVKNQYEGEIKIKVESDDKNITVSVIDNGGGISQEIFDKIFEPYFSTKEVGTGIGLYMAREIMNNMGGSINISNFKNGVIVKLMAPRAVE